MSSILIGQLITCIAIFSLGFLVLKKGIQTRVNFYFLVFTLGVAAWNLSLFLAISELGATEIWGRLAFSFGSFAFAGLYLFSIVFPWADKAKKRELVLLFISGIFFFIVPLTNLMVRNIRVVNNTYLTGDLGPLYYFFTLYSFALLFLAFFKLLSKYKNSEGVSRLQLKYVFLGVNGFLIPIIITQFILPMMGIFSFNNLGPIFSVVMVSFIAYAITRYRFLDIRLIIQRTTLYLIVISFVTVLYAGLSFLFEKFLVNFGSLFSSIIVAMILAIGFPKFKDYFHKKTDRYFYRRGYNYWDALRNLNSALRKTIELKGLIEEIERALQETLKIKKVISLLPDQRGNFKLFGGQKEAGLINGNLFKKFTETNGRVVLCEELPFLHPKGSKEVYEKIKKAIKVLSIDAIIPVFLKGKVTAIFLLGNKLSKEPYVEKDIQLFNMFSENARAAIDNSRLYEAIKKSNANLGVKIEERTKELKELYEVQSRFLADVSHELQTPLAIIKINSELLAREDVDSSNKEMLDTINQTATRISKLVRSLLWLARSDSGQVHMEKTPLRVGELIKEVCNDGKILAKNKKISFNLTGSVNATISGNREKLREVFLNLISNAIKYTEAGGSINLTQAKNKNEISISIKDSGKGISPQDLPHIFERFYRIKDSGTVERGTGLGLAICQEVIQSHRGTIKAESKVGKGSKFTVTLPVLKLS